MKNQLLTTLAAAVLAILPLATAGAQSGVAPADVKAIAEEACIYGLPLVMNYGTMYEYFIDDAQPQYKCPLNVLYNTARVYTPADTTVVTPNSDTPYSFIGMDLRAEPLVLCVPAIEKQRYFSVQLVDMYTFNYGYAGSRTTGNDGGCFLIAGPGWNGETPAGVDKVFRCETEFSIAIIRTQLFNAADIDNVKKVQAGYKCQTLSQYLKSPAPPAAPAVDWPQGDKELIQKNPFEYLAFVLQFCPPTGDAAVEKPLRARFAKIGIEAGKPFDAAKFSPEQKAAMVAGMQAGMEKIKQRMTTVGKNENGWLVSTDAFGNRAMMKGDWTTRAAAAMAGIYGNDAAEALYPMLVADSDGNKADCSKHNYTLTFPKGQLPPANAFWSVTMYDGKTQLLVNNPINRYLVNSPMLPQLAKNADGSLTIYIQHEAPAGKESNWLPAPDGPVYIVMRLYWPKEAALSGTWQPPAVVAAAE
ncbi:MAG: DUF1254 domain-containing protein [Planctomycetales bacterium]|nr:DUF1254 domain-containing protein [Planctomycetales bacterium]